jgi:hypothetical protein
MALSPEDRSRLERLPSLVQPLLTLAAVPNPAIATVTYAYGVVMRIFQLGTEVRAVVGTGRDALDSKVRMAGLFRVPLGLNVRDLQLASFVRSARRLYPKALEQLEDDVRVLDDPRHADRKGARERLAIARSVIPRVYEHFERTGELRHPTFPLLSLAYLQLLNPGERFVYRALIANLHVERATLFDDDESSPNLLGDRLPAYVQAQLHLERQNLDAMRQEALDATVASVRKLYWSFVFGEGEQRGVLGDAVGFIVERAVERIEDERSELKDEGDRLKALPADQRDVGRLEEIKRREDELADLVKRLQEGPA